MEFRERVAGWLISGCLFAITIFVVPDAVFQLSLALLAAGAALVAIGVGVVVFARDGLSSLWRWSKVRNNPLDPALRPLVASDLSWQNCALDAAFSEAVLTHFRFLVEDEGFAPARKEPTLLVLSFRREDFEVSVFEQATADGSVAALAFFLFRTRHSALPIAERVISAAERPMGDGMRGAAFHLRTRLHAVEAALRHEASEGAM